MVWNTIGLLTILLHEYRPKPFHFAIVDEVDSVLIDEGRNPLLISGEVSSRVILLFVFLLWSSLSSPYSFFLLFTLLSVIILKSHAVFCFSL